MTIPKSPFETTLAESWLWTIKELEQTLARWQRVELRHLIDLTRQIAASSYGQVFRAGTSLKETLVVSTAARHGLEPDDPVITVGVEGEGGTFCIQYYGGRAWNEDLQALVKTYDTDNSGVIAANLRRDLADFYYPCAFAEGWETLRPLLERLQNETHS